MNKNTHISWYIIISCVFYFLSIWSRPFSFEILGMWNLQIFKFSVLYHIIAFQRTLFRFNFFIFTTILIPTPIGIQHWHILVNSLFSLWIVSLLIFNMIPINLDIVATICVSQTILRVGCHLRMSKIERKYKWNLSIAYAFKEQFST